MKSDNIIMMKDKIQSFAHQLYEIRHRIHQHPELGFDEINTSDLVAQKLAEWGYEVHRGLGKTGVVGTLRRGDGKKSLGLRADLDALPMQENSGKAWESKLPNRMHACGHDGHTTMLLGAAKYLAENGSFDGTLHLIFQPAEETLRGGPAMLNDGLFTLFPCDAIFGMHNMPGMPVGEIFCQHGALMASSDQFKITVTGKGGHGAMPSLAIDPVVAASHIVIALQSIVSRNVDPMEAAVITVGSIIAGEAANVIPNHATLALSVRTLNPKIQQLVRQRIATVAKAQAESFGATAEIELIVSSPVLINDEQQTRFAYQVAKELLGEKAHYGMTSFMGSEDFAFMLQANPNGSYLIIGNGEGVGGCSVHNPGYDFNDECLVPGSAFWSALTERYLC